MRGTKMRRCRKEYLLLIPLVGILGQDAWWKPGPGVNWDVSEAAVHTLLRAQQVVTLYRTLVCRVSVERAVLRLLSATSRSG